MCWKVNLVISVTHVSVSTIKCATYNYPFNRHSVSVNKLAQIHFTMWCFPSCQNDRGRFCSFLRGLAAPFPCGSFIDTSAGFFVGGSDFCPMIESIFSQTSASLASAGCAGSSCCLRRALVRSLQRHSTLRATPRQKKSSFPRASVYVALLSRRLDTLSGESFAAV